MTEIKPVRAALSTALRVPFLRNILLVSLFAASVMPLYGMVVSHPQYVALLVSVTEDEAARVARHLSQSLLREGVAVTRENLPQGFKDDIKGVEGDFKLEKVKVFSTAGIVVYSTDAQDIGSRNEHAYFREQVAKGQVFTKVAHKEAKTAEGQVATADVVETYQPIMHEGHFLGAFELYYDITDRLGNMDRLMRSAVIQMVVIILLLGGAMVFVLFRAARAVDERDRAQQRLKLGTSVIHHASEGIIVTDARGVISMVNPAFSRMTGYSEAEAIGADPKILRSGRHDDEFYVRMWAALLDTGYWQGEIWNRRKNGEVYPEWLNLNAIRDSEGRITNFFGMFSDISTLKEAADDLERLAFYDPLTALPNRILFRERLERSLKVARRSAEKHTAVLYLDLDKFKRVNDSYGHTTGDALLQEAAKRLSGVIREVDTVARLGGDEFAIVLHEIADVAIPRRIAKKIIATINEPFYIDGHTCHVGTSIGIAVAPDHAEGASALVQLADAAMYVAKNDGRNRFHQHTNHPAA